MSILKSFLNWQRRIRLEMAEADLVMLESRAPQAIRRQREIVWGLRRELGLPLIEDAETIAKRRDLADKIRLLGGA